MGVSPTNLEKMHKRGTLPAPDLQVDGQDVWLWKTLAVWASRANRSPSTPRAHQHGFELLGLKAIGVELGVRSSVVAAWYQAGRLPPPDYRFGFGDAWLRTTVERWKRLSPKLRWGTRP